MESDVAPLLNDEVYDDLLDLLHLAIDEAYKKGMTPNVGREKLVTRVCDSLRAEFYGYDSETDYYAGFDDDLKRAMRIIKSESDSNA